jgi:hypothetical protein
MTDACAHRTGSLAVLCATLFVLVLGGSAAQAASCTKHWKGGGGNSLWTTAANWSPAGEPEAGSVVCLDNTDLSGSYVVELNVEPHLAINSISIEGSGGATVTLLIDGIPAYDHGRLTLADGGTVGPHGAIDLGSTNKELTGGTHGGVVSEAGTLLNEGSIVSENTNDETPNYIDGSFDNVGTLLVQNAFEGSFADWTTSGTIAVEAGQTMRISAAGESSSFTQTAGTLANQGALEQTGGSFAANGTGVATGNPLVLERDSIAPSGSGSGTLHVKGGGITLTSDIAAGYTVWSSGIPGYSHGKLTVAGSHTNRGTLELGSLDGTHGAIESSGGTLTNAGTIVFQNTANGPDGIFGPLLNDGVIRLENPVEGNGQITNAGSLSVPAGVTLEAESLGQTAGGTLLLGRAASGSAPVTLSGAASLAGAIAVNASGLASGSYPLVAAHSRTGAFGAASVAGGSFGIGYTATGVELVPAKPAAGVLHVLSVKGGADVVNVTLSCSAGGTSCAAALKVTLVEHLRHGKVVALSAAKTAKRTVTIAAGSTTLAAGTTRKLTLKLNQTGKRLQARHSTLQAAATVTSAGHTVRSATVSITRPKKHR